MAFNDPLILKCTNLETKETSMSSINTQNAPQAIAATSIKPKLEEEKKEAEAVTKEKPVSKVADNKDISEA